MTHLSIPKQRSPRLSPSPPPPSSLTTIDAAEERKQCLEWLTVPLKRGDIYYVIDVTWFKQWCNYAGYNMDKPDEVGDHSGIRPGPIDNIQLILDTPWLELKPGLLEHEHYELVHSRVWQLLVSWYGVSRSNNNPYNNDGHTIAIPRQVVVRGLRQQEVVEVYPSFFGIYYVDPAHPMETTPVPPTVIPNLHHYQAGDGRWVYVFSQYSSLQDILDTFSIIVTGQQPTSKPEGRVWRRIPKDGKDDLPDADDWKLIPATDVTSNKIEFLELPNGTDLLLEWKNGDGKFQRTGQVLAGRTWGQFQINDEIDAMDTQKKWFESTIRDVKEGKVFVHFKGWTTRWDEWIPTTGPGSERLAPKNTYTSGPFEPKGDSTTSRLQRQNSVGAPPERGAVGLRNLGNTCFMNSTLQCLSNTPGLTEYFADNRHLAEINRDNPLGWQGKVAEEYGLLINDIWSGQYRTVTPSGFKRVIGEFQPRFSGYQQHDSSELLSFLLDGLHEDLNRVVKKPPTTAVESNGRPDAVVAAEAWERHLLRNRSVIVDLCQGQLKSRVVCPDCKKESITFDPFMFLSVPLPHAGHHRQSITFIRMASTSNPHPLPPTKYHLKLNKQSNVSEMRQVLAKEANLPPNYNLNGLLVVELINNKIARFMNEQTMVSSFRPDDNIVVYDLPIFGAAWVKAREPGISQAEIKQTEIVVHKGQNFKRDGKNIFPIGPQFILPLQTVQLSTMPVALLRRLVRDAISPFVRDGFHSEDEDKSLYTIHIANKDGSQLIAEVPHDSATVDLQAATANHSYTLALVWNDTSRFIPEPVDVNGAADVPIKKGVDVYDCIQAFSQEETLRQSEAWYCSNCKQHKCATKKFDLWRLPDILIIHLKRFSYNKYFRDKLDTMVDFPVEGLDLRKWCPNSDEEKSSVYDLYAVSNHFGGLGGGHYTAYAKNLVDKRWYNLDDSSVSPITDVNRVKTAAAYVLFYHRRQPQQSSYSKSRSAT